MSAPLISGGRADIMIRCYEVGIHDITAKKLYNMPIATIDVRGDFVESEDLEPWAPAVIPSYL